MSTFTQYRRSQIAELRPYVPGEEKNWPSTMSVSISEPDREAGSPRAGDMIARNPKNHADQWLVAAQYFSDNFELMPSSRAMLAAAPAPPSPDARVEELERALRAIGSTDTYTTADGKDQTAGLMRKMARAALAKPAR